MPDPTQLTLLREVLVHESILPERQHDRHCTGRREAAFGEAWRKANVERRGHNYGRCALEGILSEKHSAFGPYGPAPTQRDATVAATVVVWMGTNCGQQFLRNVYDSCPEANPNAHAMARFRVDNISEDEKEGVARELIRQGHGPDFPGVDDANRGALWRLISEACDGHSDCLIPQLTGFEFVRIRNASTLETVEFDGPEALSEALQHLRSLIPETPEEDL